MANNKITALIKELETSISSIQYQVSQMKRDTALIEDETVAEKFYKRCEILEELTASSTIIGKQPPKRGKLL